MLWIPPLLVALATGDPAYQELPDEARSLFPKGTEALLWVDSLAQARSAFGDLVEIVAPEHFANGVGLFGVSLEDSGIYAQEASLAFATKQLMGFDPLEVYQICRITQATRDNWGAIELPPNFRDLGSYTGLLINGQPYGPIAPQAPLLDRIPHGKVALAVNVRRASRGRIPIARMAVTETFRDARQPTEASLRTGVAQDVTSEILRAAIAAFDVPESLLLGVLDSAQYATAALNMEGTTLALDIELTLERGPGMLAFADGVAPQFADLQAAMRRESPLSAALAIDLGSVGRWLANLVDGVLEIGLEIDPDSFESFGTPAETRRVHQELLDACADLATGLGDGLVVNVDAISAGGPVELSLPAIDAARAQAALTTIATSPLGPALGLVGSRSEAGGANFCLWADLIRLEHGLGLANGEQAPQFAPLPTDMPVQHLHVQVGEADGRCTLTLSDGHAQASAAAPPRAGAAPASSALLTSVGERIDSASTYAMAHINIGPWLETWHAQRELGLLGRFKRPKQLERLAQVDLPAVVYFAFDGHSIRLGVHIDVARAHNLAANLEGVIDLF